MTVPIIPGPFSFLATAGQQFKEFGETVQEHRKFAQEQARKGIEHLENLVQLGIFPAEALSSKEAMHLYRIAGVGLAPGTQAISQPVAAKNRITSQELAAVKPGTPQAAAVAGIPTPKQAQAVEGKAAADVATQANIQKRAETASAAGGPEAEGTLDAAAAQQKLAETELQNQVTEGAKRLIGDSPEAAKLSEEAALGILPYRIHKLLADRQYLGIERQVLADNARLMLAGLNNITKAYHDAVGAHEVRRRADMFAASLDPTDQDQIDKWEKLNPAPTYDQVAEDYIKANFGMTKEEFQRKLKEGLTGSVREKVTVRGGSAVQPEVPVSPPAIDPQQQKISGAIQIVVGSKDMVATATQLSDSYKRGLFSDVEIGFIKAQLKRLLTAEQYEQFENALGVQQLK